MSNDALFCTYLIVGSLLFALGATGLAARRNLAVMTLCAAVAMQGGILVALGCGAREPRFPASLVVLAAVLVVAVQLIAGMVWSAVSHKRHANLDPASWSPPDPRTPGNEAS